MCNTYVNQLGFELCNLVEFSCITHLMVSNTIERY